MRRTLAGVATLDDPEVKALLDAPNYGVISTFNPDGSIHCYRRLNDL